MSYSEPVVVVEIVAFENLPFGSPSSRRAVARWSDGSASEALRWRLDDMLICEGDLIGKTREAIRALYSRRAGSEGAGA
jgi:hypothetical protein